MTTGRSTQGNSPRDPASGTDGCASRESQPRGAHDQPSKSTQVGDDELSRVTRHLLDTQSRARLIGRAPSFLKAIERLGAVARSEVSVVITGETGTGKEMVARAIHYLSRRAAYPFVPVNCGALPDTLIESEIFGWERGAFTDAQTRRQGLIAQAGRGTLFLDEVDALTPRAQVSLLRVLQDKTFRALGSTCQHRANVRFISASNVPLAQLARSGGFRMDFFYRLCVFSIILPPLRERREDIPLLASYFLKKHGSDEGESYGFTSEALTALTSYDWPGNIRELENVVLRGLLLRRAEAIELGDLGLPPGGLEACQEKRFPRLTFRAAKKLAVDAFEHDYLARLLGEYGGNISQAARAAGKERRDLGRLLKKHSLDGKHFRSFGWTSGGMLPSESDDSEPAGHPPGKPDPRGSETTHQR